jgi:acyl-coenzyme A thioesterase PaaI-like protein
LIANKDFIVVSKEKMAEFLNSEFPQTKCVVEAVGDKSATVRHSIGFNELRPGGTVSGPALMAIADVALYVAILGEIGLVPLAVTTSLSINYLRRPASDKDIIGKCNLMKVGRSLVVGEVALYSDGDQEPVAHVVGTYSIPPSRPR